MKTEIKKRLSDYVSDLSKASEEEKVEIRGKFAAFYEALTPEEKQETKPFFLNIQSTAKQVIATIKEDLSELKRLEDVKLVVSGAEYDLHDWMTISDYSKQHNLKVSRVQNWITRGVIPSENVLVIPQLNDVKLIKNEIYSTRV
ncbi:hypothetical protein [Dyadobacter sp. LHD-138]|uniref:hypothetical protein n=1 Tax=Dyadobacter sp. LHD-138 TaxID=3071413 RepID=UPI0027E1A643|nr:hypothetical protein [Dyadobacter sp. LHD-138]MDQ6479802.1 hypothetical protein [Dyadobacter sp. LHD-138]